MGRAISLPRTVKIQSQTVRNRRAGHQSKRWRRQEEGDSSSNPESQDSDDSLEPSDCETDHKEGRLGGLHIKVRALWWRWGGGTAGLALLLLLRRRRGWGWKIYKGLQQWSRAERAPAMSKHREKEEEEKSRNGMVVANVSVCLPRPLLPPALAAWTPPLETSLPSCFHPPQPVPLCWRSRLRCQNL